MGKREKVYIHIMRGKVMQMCILGAVFFMFREPIRPKIEPSPGVASSAAADVSAENDQI